jgi:hypothetical protein
MLQTPVKEYKCRRIGRRDDSSLKRVFLKLDLKPTTLQSLKKCSQKF